MCVFMVVGNEQFVLTYTKTRLVCVVSLLRSGEPIERKKISPFTSYCCKRISPREHKLIIIIIL